MRRHRALTLAVTGLVLVVACGPIQGAIGSPSGTATPPADVIVETAAGDVLAFAPTIVPAPEGQAISLRFRNRSTETHNLTFPALPEVRTQTLVTPGQVEDITIPALTPGDHAFVCTIHPEMTGVLRVSPG